MPQATLSIEVDVSPEKLFDVIVDFDSYASFLSALGLQESRVLNKTDDTIEVESIVKKMGFSDRYTLKYKLERPNAISWTFVKGKLTKDNKGSWKLKELEGGRTKATYSLEASFGWMVPKALVTKGIEMELPKLLDAFKKRAESA